jgi:nitrate reductase gamma subunit
MSDRNMIGTLLIVGGLALILLPSHETAVRISAFVQEMMGVGSLAAAFIVVSVVGIMIFLGGVILLWGRR